MEDRALVRSGIVRRLRPLPCKKLPALQRLPPRRKRQTPRGVGELSSFLKVERQRRDAREVVACAPEDVTRSTPPWPGRQPPAGSDR